MATIIWRRSDSAVAGFLKPILIGIAAALAVGSTGYVLMPSGIGSYLLLGSPLFGGLVSGLMIREYDRALPFGAVAGVLGVTLFTAALVVVANASPAIFVILPLGAAMACLMGILGGYVGCRLHRTISRSEKMTTSDLLKNSELFAGLETSQLEKISVLCHERSFREEMTIFSEGDEAAEVYVLTDGRLVLEMSVRPVPDRPAIPTAVELVSNGHCFGWSAILEPHRYTLSARCMTPCRMLAIKGDMLSKAMDDDAVLGRQVMENLARLVSLRLARTRLRLTSGLGLILMGKDMEVSA